jgi:pyridoxamine 5'-phosphate oxidase
MNKPELSENSVNANPFVQFEKWFCERQQGAAVIPEAVNLGTASANGRISVRTVLLKYYDKDGFVFFTNYNSLKGTQLSENPFAALHFYWPESGRQIRIEGTAEKISEKDSAEYFSKRPRESQLAAWASDQSRIIPGRYFLENRFERYQTSFKGRNVEKPPFWGGFRLVPDFFEFWKDGKFRLHDRMVYKLTDEKWIISRLAP